MHRRHLYFYRVDACSTATSNWLAANKHINTRSTTIQAATYMSTTNPEPLGDIIVWVDKKLRPQDTTRPQPKSGRLTEMPFTTMGSFIEGTAGELSTGAFDVPELERRNMSRAEREQCELDDFWGMVANQTVQVLV